MTSCSLSHQILFLLVKKIISGMETMPIFLNSPVNIMFKIFQGFGGKL